MSEAGRKELSRKVWNAVEYVSRKFDMDYGEMVGILESIKLDVYGLDKENRKEEIDTCNDSDTSDT